MNSRIPPKTRVEIQSRPYDNKGMGATIFLVINGIVVVYLILRLVGSAKAPEPTPLNIELGRRGKAPAMPEDILKSKSDFKDDTHPGERSLNCYFQFNGHTWDAFEVLGIPAGSSREACERALLDLRRKSSSDQDFLRVCGEALKSYFS